MAESPKDFIKRHAPRKTPDTTRVGENPKEFFRRMRQRQLAAVPPQAPGLLPEH